MLEVLKTVPGVKEPTLNLGVTNHQEWAYLDYMYPNQYGNDVNVRFSAHNQDKKATFTRSLLICPEFSLQKDLLPVTWEPIRLSRDGSLNAVPR